MAIVLPWGNRCFPRHPLVLATQFKVLPQGNRNLPSIHRRLSVLATYVIVLHEGTVIYKLSIAIRQP